MNVGSRLGIKRIGSLVLTLAEEADHQYVAMVRFAIEAQVQFRESGSPSGSDARFWPEEHALQRADIANRTHEISEMIEDRISLTN